MNTKYMVKVDCISSSVYIVKDYDVYGTRLEYGFCSDLYNRQVVLFDTEEDAVSACEKAIKSTGLCGGQYPYIVKVIVQDAE